MSQLIGYQTPERLYLAADRCVAVTYDGKTCSRTLRKLFRLGSGAAVATGGAAMGINVSKALSSIFAKRPSYCFADLEEYIISVFQKEYDDFVNQGQHWFASNPDAPRRACILLGGRDVDGSLALRFYASEEHGQPFSNSPLTGMLTMPRRLGLEMRLGMSEVKGPGHESIKRTLFDGMSRIAEVDETVAGPFDLAVIDQAGVRIEELH